MNIYIKPAELCNLRCLHCYNAKEIINKKTLDLNQVRSFLSKIEDNLNNYYIIHGGEPLLLHIDYLKELRDIKPNSKWRITTNLTLDLDKDKIDFLNSLDEIRTSFDIKIRFNNIKNLLTWKKNLNKLDRSKVSLIICLTPYILKHNPEDILKLLNQLKINKVYFERICITGAAIYNQNCVCAYTDIDNWLCNLYHVYKNKYKHLQIMEFYNIEAGINQDLNNYRGSCCCKKAITINSDGTIGECPNNANYDIIGTIYNEPEEAFNKKCMGCKINPKCLSCDYFKYCRGGCEQQLWQDNICPYPKKLFNLIRNDLNEHNSQLQM